MSENSDTSSTYYSSDEEDQKDKDIIFDPITFFKDKKELFYFKQINRFFMTQCSEFDVNQMVDIINKKSAISLRVLDWFITKYTCKTIDLDKEIFDINIHYKAQLKSYKKRNFDPFKRGAWKRFYYSYDKNNTNKKVRTTISQLNFFKWVITEKIIIYVEKNIDNIIKAMNIYNKEKKLLKEQKKLSKNKNKKELDKVVEEIILKQELKTDDIKNIVDNNKIIMKKTESNKKINKLNKKKHNKKQENIKIRISFD